MAHKNQKRVVKVYIYLLKYNYQELHQSQLHSRLFYKVIVVLPPRPEVGGLIGQATSSQSGLMPAFRTMNTQYSTGQVVKYNLPASVGFSMCITAIKNHESNGQAVVILTGYQGGIVADAIRKGSYLQGISYVTNSDSIDIYVKVSVYVFVSAVCLGSSHGKFINSSSLVNEVPSDAINVPIS